MTQLFNHLFYQSRYLKQNTPNPTGFSKAYGPYTFVVILVIYTFKIPLWLYLKRSPQISCSLSLVLTQESKGCFYGNSYNTTRRACLVAVFSCPCLTWDTPRHFTRQALSQHRLHAAESPASPSLPPHTPGGAAPPAPPKKTSCKDHWKIMDPIFYCCARWVSHQNYRKHKMFENKFQYLMIDFSERIFAVQEKFLFPACLSETLSSSYSSSASHKREMQFCKSTS